MLSDPRPAVDIVVPFFGDDAELAAVKRRMEGIVRRDDDSLTIVDNRPSATSGGDLRIVPAPEIQSSYHARNRGAAAGSAPWIVFIDADVEPDRDLLDRYFDAPPEPRAGILEGAVRTLPAPGVIARYGTIRSHVSNEHAKQSGFEYAQTANLAIRRELFVGLGGFAEEIRSGGDAELCFRARDAGWATEQRPHAVVGHAPRETWTGMMRQYARYGMGAEWLDERFPGFAPPTPAWRVLASLVVLPAKVAVARVRSGPEGALTAAFDPLTRAAFEWGRLHTNVAGAGRRQHLGHALGVTRRRIFRSRDR